MKILVIGGGGREHAIADLLSRSPEAEKIYVAPGNGGISGTLESVPIKAGECQKLLEFALEKRIDLTVVGPEDPLMLGLVDLFSEKGLKVFGPSASAALIEGSKIFTREFLKRINIPQPDFRIFDDHGKALKYIETAEYPLVIKADGLAAGKGVFIAKDKTEARDAVQSIMIEKAFGDAGRRILTEECLDGKEVSFFIITDGKNLIPLETAQDYKRLREGDIGPNTGGMGCYSPSAFLTKEQTEFIQKKIMLPVIRGMASEGRIYKGFLYGGLMITPDGIKVLEFNCRMGDPEGEALLPRIESDIVPYLMASVKGNLGDLPDIKWKREASTTVILASRGYPGKPETGFEIKGLNAVDMVEKVKVFHSGTGLKDGRIVNTGGRVLAVTALGDDIRQAKMRAYEAVSRISFEGMQYRKDIASDVID
jgi:phosphoribosylamine--glycine ligase